MKLHARTRTMLPWLLWLATFGCLAVGLVVTLAYRPLTVGLLARGAADAIAFSLGFATVGLILTLRRPTNPIGWLYAAAGLAGSLTTPVAAWVEQLVRDDRPLPVAAQLGAVAVDVSWAPWIALGVTLPALLLPDGRLRSGRWRVVVATAVAGPVLFMAAASVAPGPLQELPIDNPFGLAGAAGTVAGVIAYIGVGLHWASLPAALLCAVLRFRASRGVERQQMRWVAAGAAGAVVGLLLTLPAWAGLLPEATTFVIYPALLCPPVAIAVAVLRYRLWDLDRLVSRTVTWASVTVLLVVPYLLIVPATSRLAGGAGSLAVAAATLTAVALFQPLRRRVQDRVDRRFNRRRYDSARTVATFAWRLREQVDLDALTAELIAVVHQTVQPTQASLWLRPPARPQR
ncbi:MAG TPA: hypothetical protein VHK89_02545 [Actinomycetota bacterium]|nr:hypothetical protein [Actinomycetota bacterium]